MGFVLGIFPHLLDQTILRHMPKAAAWAASISGAAAVCYSRMYLQYHTARQVAVGFFIGLALGSLWSPVIYYFSREPKGKVS